MPTVPGYRLPEGTLKPLKVSGIDIGKNAVPANPISIYAEAGQKIADEFTKRQDAFNKAEGVRLAANTIEQSKSIIQTNAQEITDPDEFETKTKDALRGLYDSAKGNSNRAVANYAREHLEPQMISATRNVGALKFAKQRDRAKSAADQSLQTYSRIAIEGDTEEERADARGAYADLIGHLGDRGFLSADQAGDYFNNFEEGVRKGRAARFGVALTGELDQMVNGATTGSQPAEELFKAGVAKIDAFTDMPLAQRENLKSKFKDSLWTGAMEGRIEKDPFKADEELRSGLYNDRIDQQSLRFLKNKASTEIDRIARQGEAIRKERERQIGKSVDDFKGAVMNGFPWSGNVANLAASVRGTEHEKEFLETLGDSQELFTFGQMAPLQQEDYLRAKSQGAKSGSEAQLFKKLEAAHEQTKSGLKEDPLAFAIRRRAIPNLSSFDLNNPNSLKERSLAAGIVENRYGVPASPLSDDEAQTLSDKFSKAPADKQVTMLQSLRSGFEDRHLRAVAGQIAKKKDDPVLAYAMGLSVDSPEAASRILRGRDIMKDNREIMPKGADLKTAQDKIASALSEAYKHNPEHYSAVSDAVMTVYAFKSWQQKDLSGDINTSRLEEAIKEASGGVITVGRGFFGGGYTVQPPKAGMNETQFLDLVKRADYSKARGMKAADIQKHGILESVGAGRYLVKIGPGYVQSDKGPFVLDLNLPPRGAGAAKVGGVAGLVK